MNYSWRESLLQNEIFRPCRFFDAELNGGCPMSPWPTVLKMTLQNCERCGEITRSTMLVTLLCLYVRMRRKRSCHDSLQQVNFGRKKAKGARAFIMSCCCMTDSHEKSDNSVSVSFHRFPKEDTVAQFCVKMEEFATKLMQFSFSSAWLTSRQKNWGESWKVSSLVLRVGKPLLKEQWCWFCLIMVLFDWARSLQTSLEVRLRCRYFSGYVSEMAICLTNSQFSGHFPGPSMSKVLCLVHQSWL